MDCQHHVHRHPFTDITAISHDATHYLADRNSDTRAVVYYFACSPYRSAGTQEPEEDMTDTKLPLP